MSQAAGSGAAEHVLPTGLLRRDAMPSRGKLMRFVFNRVHTVNHDIEEARAASQGYPGIKGAAYTRRHAYQEAERHVQPRKPKLHATCLPWPGKG